MNDVDKIRLFEQFYKSVEETRNFIGKSYDDYESIVTRWRTLFFKISENDLHGEYLKWYQSERGRSKG